MTNGLGNPIEYDERSDETWAENVAKTLTWEDRDGTWVLTGSCPRCGDEMYKAFPAETFGTEPTRGAGPRTHVVACNCEGEHPGRPDGKTGCGVYGGLELADE
jgi:hypothetical protein